MSEEALVQKLSDITKETVKNEVDIVKQEVQNVIKLQQTFQENLQSETSLMHDQIYQKVRSELNEDLAHYEKKGQKINTFEDATSAMYQAYLSVSDQYLDFSPGNKFEVQKALLSHEKYQEAVKVLAEIQGKDDAAKIRFTDRTLLENQGLMESRYLSNTNDYSPLSSMIGKITIPTQYVKTLKDTESPVSKYIKIYNLGAFVNGLDTVSLPVNVTKSKTVFTTRDHVMKGFGTTYAIENYFTDTSTMQDTKIPFQYMVGGVLLSDLTVAAAKRQYAELIFAMLKNRTTQDIDALKKNMISCGNGAGFLDTLIGGNVTNFWPYRREKLQNGQQSNTYIKHNAIDLTVGDLSDINILQKEASANPQKQFVIPNGGTGTINLERLARIIRFYRSINSNDIQIIMHPETHAMLWQAVKTLEANSLYEGIRYMSGPESLTFLGVPIEMDGYLPAPIVGGPLYSVGRHQDSIVGHMSSLHVVDGYASTLGHIKATGGFSAALTHLNDPLATITCHFGADV